jgi:hypothetical protein
VAIMALMLVGYRMVAYLALHRVQLRWTLAEVYSRNITVGRVFSFFDWGIMLGLECGNQAVNFCSTTLPTELMYWPFRFT